MDIVRPLNGLARSFARHLAAENKAPKTIEAYGAAVEQLVTYLDVIGIDNIAQMKREHVESFIVTLLETRSPATASKSLPSTPAVLQVVGRRGSHRHEPDGEDEATARS